MKICEKDVARIWQEGRFKWLRDDAGNTVRVIFGGRPAVKPGCDFQDAVLEFNGQKRCGDIEIHVSSDLWKKHGHDRNPAYNNVIMHVAMRQNGGLPALMQGEFVIPTVILAHSSAQFVANGCGCPYAGRLNNGEIVAILTSCGQERFNAKVSEFAEQINCRGAEQALYQGICRALGYSRNKAPMEKLAELLPLFSLQEVNGYGDKLSLALATAGLASSGSTAERMDRDDWCFSNVRPSNHPEKRVAALCALAEKLPTSWVDSFLAIIRHTDVARAATVIEQMLMVGANGGCNLIGTARAREISVNVILPFYAAFASERDDAALADNVTVLYAGYASLPDNEIALFMREMLSQAGGWPANACRQQGLLHIFHTYCRVRDCGQCPLAKRRRPGWGPRRGARYLHGLT